MKVDLTARDLELMLMLLNDEVTDKIDLNDPNIIAIEEFTLLEKLENALRNGAAFEQETFDMKTSNVFH
jgi:hypothetical protein